MFGWKILASFTMAAVGALSNMIGLNSGLDKGDNVPAFEPTHVTGADKNTETCPVCKYGALPAVQVWVNQGPSGDHMKIAKTLEAEMAKFNAGKLAFKSFMIFKSNDGAQIAPKLVQLAKLADVQDVAMAWLPPTDDAYKGYRINPGAKTTILIYKNRKVQDKFVDLKIDEAGLKQLKTSIEKMMK